jgi:multidrug resistance efflux pump
MADQGAVKVTGMPVQDVAHTMKAARLLYSAPGYILRGPIYMIFVVTFTGLFYSFWSKVDDLVLCPGLELRADITRVQAPKSGTVAQVFVNENDIIKAYTNLLDIQLRTGAAESEVDQIQESIDKLEEKKRMVKESKELKAQRTKDLRQQIEDDKLREKQLLSDIEKEDALFQDELRKATADMPILESDLQNAMRDIAKAEESLKTRRQEEADAAASYEKEKKLLDQKLTTEPAVQQLKTVLGQKREAVITTDLSLSQVREKINQIKLRISEMTKMPDSLKLKQQRMRGDREVRRNSIRESIANKESQIAEIELSMKQSESEVQAEIDRLKQKKDETQRLMPNVKLEGQTATVSSQFGGKVVSVFVKPDQPINRGDPMFGIWRDTERIYAEIYIRNDSIGRVKRGLERQGKLEVKIKYGAYPYQEYGSKRGFIRNIAEKPSSEIKGHETDYLAKIELEDLDEKGPFTWHQKSEDGKPVPMTMGLVGFAEIKTGERKLIEILFTPVSKFFQNE